MGIRDTFKRIGDQILAAFEIRPIRKRTFEQGPRIADLTVLRAEEGKPIAQCFGPTLRVPCQLIFSTDLIEKAAVLVIRDETGANVNTTFSYFAHVAVAACEGPIVAFNKIFANGKLIYDAATPLLFDQLYDSITFHLGTEDQVADPLLVTENGVNETPAFINTAYFVIDDLVLIDFGNQIPQFSVEIEAQIAGASSAGQTATLMTTRSDIAAAAVDGSALSRAVRGIVLSDAQTAVEAIELVLNFYRGRARLSSGVLEFLDVGAEDVLAVDSADLGAAEVGNRGSTQVIQIVDTTDTELPREVIFQFSDIDKEFQTGSEHSRRALEGTQKREEVNGPTVFNAAEAKQYAEDVLREAVNERQSIRITLPQKYIALQETDVMLFAVDGTLYRARVQQITQGFNFLHEVDAVIEAVTIDEALDPVWLVFVNICQLTTQYVPPTLLVQIQDLAALPSDTSQILKVGFLRGHVPINDVTQSARYFQRFNSATEFALLFEDFPYARIGRALTALSGNTNHLFFDLVNTVDIVLSRDDHILSNATQLQVLAGTNWCLLGGEIFGFTTAALVAVNTYRLSGLLRGRRDTDDQMGHNAAECFAFLDDLIYEELTEVDIAAARQYKITPDGQDLSTVASTPFTPTGRSLRPFAVAALTGSRNPGLDLAVTWTPRTRGFETFDPIIPFTPLEAAEKYEVDIFNGVVVVRTILVTLPNTNTFGSAVYTAAEQVTDFGSAQPSITVRVYKIGDIVGRGRHTEATL